MTRKARTMATLALVWGATACQAGAERDHQPALHQNQGAVVDRVQAASKTAGSRGTGSCNQPSESNSPASGCDCGAGSDPIRDPRVQVATDPQSGRPMQVVGAKLHGAKTVTVSELLGNPEAYAGQTVRVEGDVSAMCHHERRWFAVQDPGDRSGATVRIFTAPAFLVPPRSIGKKARAEGKVEVVEVPNSARQHLAQEHELRDTGSTKAVILRATGAELI